jgi:hypothetical protein
LQKDYTYLHTSLHAYDSEPDESHKLSQWPATAICGNDITSGVRNINK